MATEYRVFGPPGTGKTTYLTAQIRKAAEERGSGAILVSSFTKAAAVEIAGRDLPIDREMVGTLHALCYRAMGSPPIAETKIREFNERQDIYRLSGDGIDLDEPEQFFDTDADRLFAEYQVYRAKLTPREFWNADVVAFAKSWEVFKYENSYIDFTDMIETALRMKLPPPGAPEIGFFDEVQDFTPLELGLIRQWAEYMEYVVLAGDDDQCIYGFKGASPTAFLNPPLPDTHKRVLDYSWRMPAQVYWYSQAWISEVVERESKWFGPREAEGQVDVRKDLYFKNGDKIADELAAIVGSSNETAMVIGACSYQIAPIVAALRKKGELFHNPYRRKRGDWNPLRAARGLSTSQRLLALLRYDNEVWREDCRPWTVGDIRDFMPLLAKTGVFVRGATERVLAGPPADATATPEMLGALFAPGVVEALRNAPLPFVRAHAASAKAKPLEYPLTIAERNGARRLFERPRIVVGTIHSVKGGEADNVFLLPDLSPAGMREYCDDKQRDGTIRQFYVGMSRARERLVLCGQSSPFAVNWPTL